MKTFFAIAFALLLPVSALALEYQPMSMDDLKLDEVKLVGKKVNVTGFYGSLGDLSMLSKEEIDPSPFSLNIRNVPRDQRKQLLQCEPNQCQIMVWGRLGRSFLGFEIAADRIQVISH